MNISFYLSSQGGSPLQVGLQRGLEQLGHQVEYWHETYGRNGCDLAVVFNQAAHTTSYAYPDFPPTSVPIAFVDSAEYGYFKRLPSVAKDYANTFSPGALAHDTKNGEEQLRLKRSLEGRSFPYFLREHLKSLVFPSSYHPIDYPLYAGSECHDYPNREEYMRRPLDLYIRWGGSHPWRINLTREMEAMKDITSDISIIDHPIPRIPQEECFRKTKLARCSISFDGYGSSSFRLTENLCRTVLVRGPLAMRMRDDLTDSVNVVDFSIVANGEDFVSSNIAEKIRWVRDNPEKAFEIYEAGYHHCFENFTEKATAKYLLKVVEGHDWTKATPLDL